MREHKQHQTWYRPEEREDMRKEEALHLRRAESDGRDKKSKIMVWRCHKFPTFNATTEQMLPGRVEARRRHSSEDWGERMHEVFEETRNILKIIIPGNVYLSKQQHGLEVNPPSLAPFTAWQLSTPIWRKRLQCITGMESSQPPLQPKLLAACLTPAKSRCLWKSRREWTYPICPQSLPASGMV